MCGSLARRFGNCWCFRMHVICSIVGFFTSNSSSYRNNCHWRYGPGWIFKEFAAGIICNAGTLGITIPPSIVMVVYAASVEVSVGRMFLAGVIPGLLAGFMLMTTIYIIAKIKNLRKSGRVGKKFLLQDVKQGGGLFLIVNYALGVFMVVYLLQLRLQQLLQFMLSSLQTLSIRIWDHLLREDKINFQLHLQRSLQENVMAPTLGDSDGILP